MWDELLGCFWILLGHVKFGVTFKGNVFYLKLVRDQILVTRPPTEELIKDPEHVCFLCFLLMCDYGRKY